MKTLLEQEEDTRVVGSAQLVEQRATAPAVVPDSSVSLFERLARDPNVGVDAMERLIAMQERIMAINRKAAFDAAYSLMQPEIPVINEHGKIEVKGTVRSTYAPLEDIHDVVKPIMARHGFSVRHRTEWPEDRKGIVRIVGILSHAQGHSEETTFEAPMDKSDFRSDIQSMGSTISYGRRYTTMDLLNIATKKADNDGNRRQQPQKEEPKSPAGYEAWLESAEAVAVEGWEAYAKLWNDPKSKPFRKYLVETNPNLANKLQLRAKGVK
jgi:hypothetical protein